MSELMRPESFKEQIYKILKSKILNFEYQDGEILNERKISEELNVSRTPVREALKALEAEDWVEYIPYKGIVIKQMSLQELEEIFQIRKVLESLMVELALPKITNSDIERLQKNVNQQHKIADEGSNNYEAFLALDTEFHGILADINPNNMLKKTLSNFREKIRRQGLQSLYSGQERFGNSVQEHQKILDAIQKRDMELAKHEMEDHIERVYETACNKH